jgi:hypothetical protein
VTGPAAHRPVPSPWRPEVQPTRLRPADNLPVDHRGGGQPSDDPSAISGNAAFNCVPQRPRLDDRIPADRIARHPSATRIVGLAGGNRRIVSQPGTTCECGRRAARAFPMGETNCARTACCPASASLPSGARTHRCQGLTDVRLTTRSAPDLLPLGSADFRPPAGGWLGSGRSVALVPSQP